MTTGECSYEVKFALAQVLSRAIQMQKLLEEQKAVMEQFPKKEIYKVFKGITGKNSQHIEKKDLEEYIKENEMYLNEEDTLRILKRLDKDRDGKVSYVEFLEAFTLEEVDANAINTWDRELEDDTYKVIETLKEELKQYEIPKELEKKNIDTYTQTEYKEEKTLIQRKSSEEFREESKSSKSSKETASFPETPDVLRHTEKQSVKEPILTSIQKASYSTPITYPESAFKASAFTAASTYRFSPSPPNSSVNPVLIHILKTQLSIATEVEEVKTKLWLRHDFNVVEAFRFFDNVGHGTITIFELKKALKRLDLNFHDEDLQLLMKRHDQNRDGKLCIGEFERMIRPIDYANFPSKGEAKTISGELKFSRPTTEILKQLLEKLVESEIEMEELRKEVIRKSKVDKFDFVSAFNTLNNLKKEYIFLTDVSFDTNLLNSSKITWH